MKALGIRVRLAAWYSLILAISLCVFGGVAYFSMARSIRDTLDEGLRGRLAGARYIIAENAPHGAAALEDELQEYSDGDRAQGKLRVAVVAGNIIFASPGMEPLRERLWRGKARSLFNARIDGKRFRVLRQTIESGGASYDVALAHSMEDFDWALARFRLALYFAVPGFLLLAGLGGYWMSRRALAPVDEITHAARSIGAQDLARRLAVPRTGDELERLADTLNEMLARLDTAFQRITQFTADASHELRTPVSVIRTSSELTLRKPRTAEEYQESLSQILHESEKVSGLIEQLLVLARADAGSGALAMERTNLAQPLRDACHQAGLLAEAKRLTLENRLPDQPLWVQGDSSSLERLFLILLDNAVKYTATGGKIEVTLGREDGFAVAEVSDTGIGISADDLPHVFERFYRADRARSRESGGTGLGLAIGRWIAQVHRGEIRVRSALSEGSTFQVRVPLAGE